MAKGKKRYDILSPDGISIHFSDTYKSIEEAKAAFENWKKRYEAQGYYSSNRGRNIKNLGIKLTKQCRNR